MSIVTFRRKISIVEDIEALDMKRFLIFIPETIEPIDFVAVSTETTKHIQPDGANYVTSQFKHFSSKDIFLLLLALCNR